MSIKILVILAALCVFSSVYHFSWKKSTFHMYRRPRLGWLFSLAALGFASAALLMWGRP